MTRVLIFASSPVTRAGLLSVIGGSPSFEIVGAVESFTALDEQTHVAMPDVAVLALDSSEDEDAFGAWLGESVDGEQPGPDAPPPSGTGSLNAANAPPPALVVLADHLEHGLLGSALASGVRALLPRGAAADEIIAAVHAAAAGLVTVRLEAFEELRHAQGMSDHAPVAVVDPSASEALTPRELEVLQMLAEGLGNKEVAWRLKISEHTVKFHISSIFNKLDASSRTEAVTIGIRQGLIAV